MQLRRLICRTLRALLPVMSKFHIYIHFKTTRPQFRHAIYRDDVKCQWHICIGTVPILDSASSLESEMIDLDRVPQKSAKTLAGPSVKVDKKNEMGFNRDW